MLLDDPSPLVRRALAEALASARGRAAGRRARARQRPAGHRRCRSSRIRRCCSTPIWSTRSRPAQPRCAGRDRRPAFRCRARLAAAIAEVGAAEACLALLENPERRHRAVLARPHRRALRPSGADPRSAAGARRSAGGDAPGAGGRSCPRRSPASSPRATGWDREHAECTAHGACEKATVALAADTRYDEVGALIRHLRESGQLTAGLVLRALLSGNVELFEEALAELSGLPIDRVTALHPRPAQRGLPRALSTRPACRLSAYPAFREAIEAMREGLLVGEPGGAARLKRRMVERVLTRCADEARASDRAAADAAAPLCGRSRARRGAAVLRRAGRAKRSWPTADQLFRAEPALSTSANVRDRAGLSRRPVRFERAGVRRCRAPQLRLRRRLRSAHRAGDPAAGHDAIGRLELLENVRPVAVLVEQKFVGHLAQPFGQAWPRVASRRSAHVRG